MNILMLEPYFAGSHRAWIEGYTKKSRHTVDKLTLPGRYWKWRMHGGAVTLAREFNANINGGGALPDLIIASDMLDLTVFLALTRQHTSPVPTAVYFHENQFTYPWSPGDRDVAAGRDTHFGFINISTALAADKVYFNSRYHMESFLTAAAGYLEGLPEPSEKETADVIRAKSSVLHLGLDLAGICREGEEEDKTGPPLILWNHRWEYDKNPAEFFEALYVLDERGRDFRVAILGENFKRSPEIFNEAREKLGDKVVHYGFAEDFASYARWLRRTDILPVTSIHDFFGASVVEAVFAGAWPILPNRLAYPEHFGPEHFGTEHFPEEVLAKIFYDDFDGLVERLEDAVTSIDKLRADKVRRESLRCHVEKYDWQTAGPLYDEEFASLVAHVAPVAPVDKGK